jgi:hypothetical protein
MKFVLILICGKSEIMEKVYFGKVLMKFKSSFVANFCYYFLSFEIIKMKEYFETKTKENEQKSRPKLFVSIHQKSIHESAGNENPELNTNYDSHEISDLRVIQTEIFFDVTNVH